MRVNDAMNEQNPPILGRDEECERVERFLSRSRPAMLLLEGNAGIGKTTVWRRGVESAEKAGFRVLEFRAAWAERSLTFAGLAGLLPDRVLDEVLSDLPEPRRRALETALSREERSGGVAETGVLGLGVVSVLSVLSAASPVMLAIDDLQWLDEPTIRVLEFGLRRLGRAEVVVLAARRTAGPDTVSHLASAFHDDRREQIVLGPLSVGTIGRLAHDRLGLQLPRVAAARLHQESAGNPFIALELARAASDRGSLPGPGQPFPVSADAASLVGRRIERLAPEAGQALVMLASLARPTDELLQRAIGGAPARRALRELIDAELVRVEEHEPRCAHPLIASVAYARTPPPDRLRIHRRLAQAVDDLEERARHLALGAEGPDEAVATALDGAAEAARRRGASDGAADLAELAVSLSPPADLKGIARRELTLAGYQMDAGSPAEALGAAAAAAERLPLGPARANARVVTGRIQAEYLGDVASANRSFGLALQEAEGDRATLVRAHIAAGHWGVDDFPGGGPGDEALHARAALELLGEDDQDDPDSASTALLMLVEAGFREGQGFDTGVLDRAIALESTTRLPLMDRASTQGAIGLGLAGRHHESIRAVDTFLVEAEEEDDWSARPILLRSLTWMWWCVGDIREASKVARRALQAAEDIGASEGATRGMGAQIRAAAGDEGEARAWAAEAIESAREFGSWWWELRGRAAVLFLELTLGNEEAAADAAIAVRDLAARAGDAYEPGWIRIHGDMVEGLLGAGRFDEASSMTGWFEARAAVSGHPWSVMVSSRCRGLLAAWAGRSAQALTCFDRSLAADERGEMALERGRTLLATGQVLRAGNRRSAARDAFGQARAVFEACGCPSWASRVTAELARASGRVATPSELTGMERRVAELAASGRSNREIAAELFLSVRTVESHLSSAYRKLGIRSRIGLGPALRDPQREA